MGHRVKLIVDYPYGGDNDTLESIQKEEHDAIMNEEVSLADIIGAGGAVVEVLVTATEETA
jgi:hypothetical protein